MDDPATRVEHALLDVQINERTRDGDTALLGLIDKWSPFGRGGEEIVENDALSGLQCLPNPRNELPQRSASVISAESDRGGHAFAELLRQRGLATGGRPHDDFRKRWTNAEAIHGTARGAMKGPKLRPNASSSTV